MVQMILHHHVSTQAACIIITGKNYVVQYIKFWRKIKIHPQIKLDEKAHLIQNFVQEALG